jgi:hypothetical protein
MFAAFSTAYRLAQASAATAALRVRLKLWRLLSLPFLRERSLGRTTS